VEVGGLTSGVGKNVQIIKKKKAVEEVEMKKKRWWGI